MSVDNSQSEHRKLTIFAVLMAGFALLLIFFSYNRLSDYQHYHLSLANISANTISDKISAFVKERQRLVKLFAQEHVTLIRNLVRHPRDDKIRANLRSKIRQYFPNHFSFTITDPTGQPFFEDFDGLVLGLCKEDINTFAKEESYAPYIHPHPDGYHFDTMARYGLDNNEGILFISFHAVTLVNMIRSAQATDHTLMLVYPDKSDLIEVVADGTRLELDRSDYRLNGNELDRVLVRRHVANTRWQAIDLYNIELFYMYKIKMYLEAITIFGLILIAMVWLVRSYLLFPRGLNIKKYDPRDVLAKRP